MNRIEEFTMDKKKAFKRFTIYMIAFCLIPLAINSAALSPFRDALSSDVLYSDSVILSVTDYLMSFLEIIAFAVTFSVIIASVFLGSKKITGMAVIIFVLSLLVQIPLSIFMKAPIYGTIGTAKEVALSLIPSLAYVLFCVLHIVFVYFAARFQKRSFLIPPRRLRKAGGKIAYDPQLLPFKKIYSKTNALQRSALFMSIIIVIPKIILHVLGHLMIGFPEGAEGIISFVLSYFTDVAYGFVAYIIALLILSSCYDKLRSKKTDEAVAPSEENSLLD